MSKLRLPRLQVRTGIASLAPYRRHIIAVALVLITAVILRWGWQLASSPARDAGGPLSLAAYGVPSVELRIVYPARLSTEQDEADKAGVVTVLARAASPEAVLPLEVLLPLPNEAVAYVDGQGVHVPGRLSILPGFADDLPYDIKVVHGNTELAGSLLRAFPVDVVPVLRVGDRMTPLPELSFRIYLESRSRDAFRRVATFVSDFGVAAVLIGVLLSLAVWVTRRLEMWRRLSEEKGVAALYTRLQGHVLLRRWSEARQEIERIRLQRPYYRDVQQLDGVVAAGETAAWRQKEQYEAGLAAYRSRDWPSAVQAFHAIEVEAPYYREVRFLRRTAALYADLGSRDRSLRITAARELGEVGDLLDMTPLLLALGDPSEDVAAAAEVSFGRIGIQAFEVLLVGLASDSRAIRERAYGLIEGLGQGARVRLLDALRAVDPRLSKDVSLLLARLGARQELAEALLWAQAGHHEAIVDALVSEGTAGANALIEVLLKAPVQRQQVVIKALAALKLKGDVDHRLEEALRLSKEVQQRELLQRALTAPPSRFRPEPAGVKDKPAPPPEEQGGGTSSEKGPRVRRLRFLEKRQS